MCELLLGQRAMRILTHVTASRPRWLPVLIGYVLIGLTSPTVAAEPTADAFVSLWEDGIGSTVAVSIQQDPTGFLWVGTQGALVRYDGYDFVVFRSDPEDPASLDDSFVSTVFIDSAGTLWVGTLAGVCRYDPVTGSFTRHARSRRRRQLTLQAPCGRSGLLIYLSPQPTSNTS